MTTQEIENSLQAKLDASEKRLTRLQEQANDPEMWAECGYYLQQDINAEISYYNVLMSKLQRMAGA